MSRREQSQEDIFLELKLIAFRKRLEEENKKNEKLNEFIKLYEQEKQASFSRFQQKSYDGMKQSLPFSIPIGIGNMFLFKSIVILPVTLAVGFITCTILNSQHQKKVQNN